VIQFKVKEAKWVVAFQIWQATNISSSSKNLVDYLRKLIITFPNSKMQKEGKRYQKFLI